jgi:hypothetical protein
MRRRSFLAAVLASSAAPVIVRAASLMPVRSVIVPPAIWIPEQGDGLPVCPDFDNCSLWKAANHGDWRNLAPARDYR